jgi:hypothetical protein
MRRAIPCAAAMTLTSCFGMGLRQVERMERTYGKPMEEIIAVERPKQTKARENVKKRNVDLETTANPPR